MIEDQVLRSNISRCLTHSVIPRSLSENSNLWGRHRRARAHQCKIGSFMFSVP